MAADNTISLVIGGRTFFFPGCKIWRELTKNLIVFKLVKDNKAKDLLRVVDTFRIRGSWYDDGFGEYDSLSAFSRYLAFISQIKYGHSSSNLGPVGYLTWNGRTYKGRVKSVEFDKQSGHGSEFGYYVEIIKVDK